MTATLTDPDGVVTITNWKWAATDAMAEDFNTAMGTDSDVEGQCEANIIAAATTNMAVGDVGDFLWAMVEYRDGYSMVDDPFTALDERNYDDEAALIPTDGDTNMMV